MSNAKLEQKLYLAKQSPEPVFDLSDCALKRIPNGIFAVIKVFRKECLSLQNNNLSTLKEGGNLCDLSLLRFLDLGSNKIVKLPPDIKFMINLQVLRVDNNELVSLPIEIGSLSNLEELTLSANRLATLPDSLCELQKLQRLDLRQNARLRSLPTVIYRNKRLQFLLLDEDGEWINPPKTVIQEGTNSILTYLARENGGRDHEIECHDNLNVSNTSETLLQLSLYDQLIQDNLRRLEKQKENKLFQVIKSEKNILDHKEKELRLHQQNQNEKQKLLENLVVQQRKLDQEVSKCHKQREYEQNKFIKELQLVENTVDEIIKQLIESNSAHKQKCITSILSSLTTDVPVKQNFHCQEVLVSMEKLLTEEYSLTEKLEENDIIRQNLINFSNLKETELKNKISDLLLKRKNEQNCLINSIKQDTELQYAAVLMLIEKSDIRNVELHNQIAVIQNQLSNLTALELQNKSFHINKNINELAERRTVLSDLLQDIFAQQQSYRMQLIEQLGEIENQRSYKNKEEYWLMQFQRLLENCSNFSMASRDIDPSLIFELALFGVSHYAPFLSAFNLKSVEDLSQITDATLINVGIKSNEDRCAILKAIRHFISEQNNSITTPSVPPLETSYVVLPSAPPEEDISVSQSANLLNTVLNNECVICMEIQSDVVFLSCGHLCCCTNCSPLVNKCPLCRCDIERKMQIFTA